MQLYHKYNLKKTTNWGLEHTKRSLSKILSINEKPLINKI